MEPGVLTLGFARRATTYKRGDLLFSDLERLKKDILKERKNPGDLCRQSPSG
jgi:starch phosphorylase